MNLVMDTVDEQKETSGVLSNRAITALNEACIQKNINIVQALENAKETFGMEGISKEYAILCNQAKALNQASYQ